MSITEEQRLDAYQNASPIQRQLYGSFESSETLKAIGEKHGVTDAQRKNYVDTVGDVILGFYSQTKLPELLQSELGIDHGKAVKLAADLIDFLEPLTREDVEEVPPTTNANLASEIAETQAQLDAIQPIRTMQDDEAAASGEEAPVHHSSQEHIFGQRPVLGETPNYQQADNASNTQADDAGKGAQRWDSEQKK